VVVVDPTSLGSLRMRQMRPSAVCWTSLTLPGARPTTIRS